MPNALRIPTEEDLARDLANSIFELSGLADDIDGLRLENQKDTLMVFADVFNEMDNRGNHCRLRYFSGLFHVLKDESRRIQLRAQFTTGELDVVHEALMAAAMRIGKGRRTGRA